MTLTAVTSLMLALTLPPVVGPETAAPMSTPPPVVSDPRMREIVYTPGQVYQIPGAFRTATQIIFSPDEIIRHAAVGDAVAWEIAAEGSVLFLKPREHHAATNLLVVTEKGGEMRHYAFDLTARTAGDRTPIVFQIRFLYPADDQAAALAALNAQARAAETHLIGLELHQGALEGPRNLAWAAQGDPSLQPSEVTDNGRFTVLRFPGAQTLPAVFEVDEEGQESLVPYDVRGDFVVVHGVPRALRLRRDGAVLCLFNEAYAPQQAQGGTRTASPAVQRTTMGGLS